MVNLRQLAPAFDDHHHHHHHHHHHGGETGGQTARTQQTIASLVSHACQLDDVHHVPSKLFRALQNIPRLLLILDGADAILQRQDDSHHHHHPNVGGEGEGEGHSGPMASSASIASHPNHDLRGFISELLRSVPGSKILVTSCSALAGIPDVVETRLEVRPLAPIDAAQLFYDLRPREIELAEFGCEDPKRAASKLSEHPALKLLAGHPRRIFNAVPNLRDVKMTDLVPIIEQQIKQEARREQQQLEAWNTNNGHPSLQLPTTHLSPKSMSRSHTPEPSPSHQSHPSYPLSNPTDLFDHNLFLWFGGSTPRLGCSSEDAAVWSDVSERGAHWWRTTFGRVEAVPWNETLERIINQNFMQLIGSNERPLEPTDLRTFQTKLESLGSPIGYMHVQVMGQFWRDWLSLTDTIRKVLPFWTCSRPTRVIHGWYNRATCTNLLIDSHHPHTGQVVNKPIGTFVLRMSESQVGAIAVGFVGQSNQIMHTLITMKGSGCRQLLPKAPRMNLFCMFESQFVYFLFLSHVVQ